jgi:hypothetical protein
MGRPARLAFRRESKAGQARAGGQVGRQVDRRAGSSAGSLSGQEPVMIGSHGAVDQSVTL